MENKYIPTPDGQKLYLVTFEFCSGEKIKNFKKGFYADSERELRKSIDRYLADYYGFKNPPGHEGKFYYYSDNGLVVNIINLEEIMSYEQIGL